MAKRLTTLYISDEVLDGMRDLKKISGIPVSRLFDSAGRDYLAQKKRRSPI